MLEIEKEPSNNIELNNIGKTDFNSQQTRELNQFEEGSEDSDDKDVFNYFETQS